eukprot:Gb_26254 [translate_table: standard]
MQAQLSQRTGAHVVDNIRGWVCGAVKCGRQQTIPMCRLCGTTRGAQSQCPSAAQIHQHSLNILRGGRLGVVFPKCPKTFQSSMSRGGEGQQSQERSQKVRRVQREDVVDIPAEVTYWLTTIPFYLVGSAPSRGQIAAGGRSIGDNILQGFDIDTLGEAMGIN